MAELIQARSVLAVRDLVAAVGFYTRVLGMSIAAAGPRAG